MLQELQHKRIVQLKRIKKIQEPFLTVDLEELSNKSDGHRY